MLIDKVEYSAASDAYTHAPEGFKEFYNQRRRWVPSTIANIMDLLMDAKRTIKINDNISMPYIYYQILLMGELKLAIVNKTHCEKHSILNMSDRRYRRYHFGPGYDFPYVGGSFCRCLQDRQLD